MTRAERTKQIRVVLPNRIGLLEEVAAALAAAQINILAVAAYEKGDTGVFMFITDSGAKAKKVLTRMGAEVSEEVVILLEMPNRVGVLQKAAGKIAAAGINIREMYGTTGSGRTSTCVIRTADDKKALKILNG